ncbi:hypothetical protein EJA05_25065 [Pseudomonas oryziphila]|uniref:Uncharacterized protein n=1 Tax=Pseudomonas entomophila TaxID=312306 RepID=A0A3Q8U486_9PSED|nr:hypothetical protein EJA05_25065 [Pseudomonas oryziphila]
MNLHVRCRSDLVPRKGCRAAPATSAFTLKSWGRFAALSRHKAAPTKGAQGLKACAVPVGAGLPAKGPQAA